MIRNNKLKDIGMFALMAARAALSITLNIIAVCMYAALILLLFGLILAVSITLPAMAVLLALDIFGVIDGLSWL